MVLDIMNYINDHISEDLSIDQIAKHVFLNRSYIMHLFRDETGYTIGKYITEKRLFLANHYISQGFSMTDACYKAASAIIAPSIRHIKTNTTFPQRKMLPEKKTLPIKNLFRALSLNQVVSGGRACPLNSISIFLICFHFIKRPVCSLIELSKCFFFLCHCNSYRCAYRNRLLPMTVSIQSAHSFFSAHLRTADKSGKFRINNTNSSPPRRPAKSDLLILDFRRIPVSCKT